MTGIRIGVNIGGTFADIVVRRPDGTFHTKKISSTVDDYSRANSCGECTRGTPALAARLWIRALNGPSKAYLS
jgi:hypothetical protein